jgi:uncharacterized protein YggU (UPF0235/DUF167 family)
MKTISVRLTPKAAFNRIGEVRDMPTGEKQLIVYVTEVAESNKANKAMICLLAKYFSVSASRISIVRGTAGRNKLIRIK